MEKICQRCGAYFTAGEIETSPGRFCPICESWRKSQGFDKLLSPSNTGSSAGSSPRTKQIAILLVLMVVLMGLLSYLNSFEQLTRIRTMTKQVLPTSRNSLTWDGGSKTSLPIPLHPAETYNFKSLADLMDIRFRRVRENSQLLKETYDPFPPIFRSIVDGKPWWGLDGLLFYGPGPRSIEGDSRESIFLGNPFLLVGIVENNAQIIDHALDFPAEKYFPTPLELIYEAHLARAHVDYRVSNYWDYLEQVKASDLPDHPVFLDVTNARDFGSNYLVMDRKESQNIQFSQTENKPELITQMFHCGGSCGYSGGCNNMSPHSDGLVLHLNSLPARAVINLYKEKPGAIDLEPDFVFILNMR